MPVRLGTMKRLLALALVALVSLAQAGDVTRPTKTCGTTTYVAERAALCTTIKSAEVDADLQAIINSVNDIETANIAAAGLGTNAYANQSVTAGKLAIGAAVNSGTTASVTDGLNITTTTETTLLTFGAITTRGGRVLITGSWAVQLNMRVGPASQTVTIRLKMDGGTIYTLVTTPTNADTGFANLTHDVPFPTFSHVPVAGAHTYTVTIQGSNFGAGGLNAINTQSANSGHGTVLELS